MQLTSYDWSRNGKVAHSLTHKGWKLLCWSLVKLEELVKECVKFFCESL